MRTITGIAALAVIVIFGGSDAGEPEPTPTPIVHDISVADTSQTIGAPRSFASLAQ